MIIIQTHKKIQNVSCLRLKKRKVKNVHSIFVDATKSLKLSSS